VQVGVDLHDDHAKTIGIGGMTFPQIVVNTPAGNVCAYSITWITLRERGSTSTVSPFTTV
jgi:hypothetical protein